MSAQAPLLAAWEEVLASFAACLRRQREVYETISGGEGREGVRTDVFSPPAGLGPLPEELRPRAELLMLEARAIERAESLLLADLRRKVRVEIPTQRGSQPSMLDARG